MAAPCPAAATPALDSDVRFMFNMSSVLSEFCARIVYDRTTVLGLRNSDFSTNLSGVTVALEPQALYMLDILHRQDPGACKAADSHTITGTGGGR